MKNDTWTWPAVTKPTNSVNSNVKRIREKTIKYVDEKCMRARYSNENDTLALSTGSPFLGCAD
ncbi:hypothetical protein ACTXT7_013323 [Hymenolepis weldensis]